MQAVYHVEKEIYRGPKPESQTDVYDLARILGIKTIVNLQRTFDLNELTATYYLNLRFFDFELNSFSPDEGQLRLIDNIIDDESLRPLYVHCTHGRERTGLVIARYRLRNQVPKITGFAYDEMIKYGCRWPFSWRYESNYFPSV